eukprot:1975829-Ditylum_brightwellii.AAC.1
MATVYNKQGRLKQPLGKWLHREGKQWSWRCSQTTLFCKRNDHWVAHNVVTSSQHQSFASLSYQETELPQATIPVPDIQTDN